MFLSANNYRDEVTGVINSSQTLRIAVAFWGKGADQLFRSTEGKSVRVICNLLSGGTNPAAIRALMAIGNVTVRHRTDLHAKVVIGDSAAIVGSANFSTDGLGNEIGDGPGWQEAGVVTADPSQVQAIGDWFEEVWLNSRAVTDEDLSQADALWALRPAKRATAEPAKDLLSEPLDVLSGKAVFLVGYDGTASEEASAVVQERVIPSISKDGTMPKNITYFEDAAAYPAGASLLCITMGAKGRVKIEGPYRRVLDWDQKFKDAKGKPHTVQFVMKDPFILGHRFDKTTRSRLESHIQANLSAIRAQFEEANWHLPLGAVLTLKS